jgi:hypothetical protein
MNTKVNVTWGLTVKIITCVVLFLLLAAEYYLIHSSFHSRDWVELTIAIALFGVVLYFAFEAPIFIELTESRLILHKLVGSYQSYVGDYAQAFQIQSKNGKNYVLSCANRDLVINTIKKQIQ